MSGIVSGVNVITEFETPESASYSGYIDYMNKEQGKQEQYKEYNDYLAKTDSLFTMEKDNLSEDEIKELKSLFEKAQENGSVLWKTVISFDNRWLEQNGIYDMKSGILNETKMREAIRKGVNRMLDNEGLQHALWSAGIHYDTDNIHVHVATVEPIPMRQKKTYKQYEVSRNEKNKLVHKKPVLNGKGEQLVKEEYVGVFKASSIKLCKSAVANEIMQQRDVTLEINSIIRDQILKNKENISFRIDPKLQEQFFKVYEMLPDCPKNMWKYGQNIMKPVRSEIDELSDLYLSMYHGKEMKRIKELLKIQTAQYMATYGDTGKDYGTGKLEDLHKRLGNIILAEMRTFALEEKENEREEFGGREIENVFPVELEEIEEASLEEEVYSKWTKEYKEARKSFYGSALEEPDEERGIRLYEQEAENGNVLALFDLAEMGYMFYQGIGTEQDTEKALGYLKKATVKGHAYAEWLIGKIYLEKGKKEEGINWLKKAAEHENPLAQYTIGKLYLKGEEVEKDPMKAKELFQKAAQQEHEYAQYYLGKMYLLGEDTEQNIEEAVKWFEKASENGNQYAQYQLGKIYLTGINGNQNMKKALEWLKKSAEQNNQYAQYMLGKIYMNGMGVEKNLQESVKWFEKSAEQENGYAQYYLGKIYLQSRDMEKAGEWIGRAIRNRNEAAIHLYVNEATKLGKISVGKEFEKVKRNFNKSMNQFIKSLRKDYEAWKNIMEHDRMLEKELNVSSTEELIV